ncbi:MAG TPA: hypothetical protein VH814_25595 [Steroidobacteraceae bacterium]|jgi:hypothetical protein
MLRTIAAVLTVAVSGLLTVEPAHAITVTLDDSDLTVVRPLTGTKRVDFIGHMTITDGFGLALASESPVFNETGNSLALSLFPALTFNQDGILFSLYVSATDVLGTYAWFDPLVTPASITWFECPIGGGLCNGTGQIHYSLNVIAKAVGEPAMIAPFGLSLGGLLATWRRKRKVNAGAIGS